MYTWQINHELIHTSSTILLNDHSFTLWHSFNNNFRCNNVRQSNIHHSTTFIHITQGISWKPIWEKPPRWSSSSMRNIGSTLQPATCRLLCRYVFLTQSSCSHALWFILLSIPIDPHTAWIDSSTLLFAHSGADYPYKMVCALSYKSGTQQPSTIRLLFDLLPLFSELTS